MLCHCATCKWPTQATGEKSLVQSLSWRRWHNSRMFCYVAQVGVVATTGYAYPSPRRRRVEKPAEAATKGLFYPLQLPYYNTYSWNVCCSVFTSYRCPLISSQHLGLGDRPFSTLRWLFMPEQQVCRFILNWQWHPNECKMQKCSWTMLYDAKYLRPNLSRAIHYSIPHCAV